MKVPLFALLLWLGTSQNPTPAAPGLVEGRVLRAGSGDPIANTPVTLISSPGLSETALAALLDQISNLVTIGLQGGGGGGSQDGTIREVTRTLQQAGPGVGVQASVLTDRAGHFAFSDLPPGRYTVWVQRFNYFGPILNGVHASTTSATITLDSAKPPAPVDLYMTQGMAIAGRVLDPRGQPASNTPMNAYRATYSDGKLVWTTALARSADDRGEYRLSPLPPGEYYVGAQPPALAVAPGGQNPSVRTFFPGVTEPSQATRLVLKGSDLTSVDFTLRTAPASFFKVSGVALNPQPSQSINGVLNRTFNAFTLVPLESSVLDGSSGLLFSNAAVSQDPSGGDFELRNVRPGIYELYPRFGYAGFLSGRTIVDVRSTDVPGVRVAVSPLVTLQGRVALTQTNPQRPVRLEGMRVALKPLNSPTIPGSNPPIMPVDQSGQFTLTAPAGATATLQIIGVPETAFVSDIRIGNTSVFDSGFEVSSTSEPIQVLIDATTGGTGQTTVQTPDGRPARNATVVLVPAEDRRGNPMRYKVARADNDGRLTLRGVAPGAYTAFAWESVPETAWQNREFLAKYRDRGTAVNVTPGAPLDLQLKWMPLGADPQ